MITKFEALPITLNFNIPMILMKLNGKNYVLWSKSFEIFLKGKGLLSYLIDSNPDATNSTFTQ